MYGGTNFQKNNDVQLGSEYKLCSKSRSQNVNSSDASEMHYFSADQAQDRYFSPCSVKSQQSVQNVSNKPQLIAKKYPYSSLARTESRVEHDTVNMSDNFEKNKLFTNSFENHHRPIKTSNSLYLNITPIEKTLLNDNELYNILDDDKNHMGKNKNQVDFFTNKPYEHQSYDISCIYQQNNFQPLSDSTYQKIFESRLNESEQNSYNLFINPKPKIPLDLIVHKSAIYSSREDHSFFIGWISIVIYIGVWIGSCLSFPGTFLLFWWSYYKIGALLLISMLCCYIFPIRPNQTFRRFCRRNFGRYFKEASIRFEHVPDQEKDKPTILCISPHGIFSLSWAYCYLTDELHHFYWCFSTLLNLSPFLRIITKLTGNPSTIQKKKIKEHMTKQNSIAIIPGGWHEASIHHHKYDRIYIKKRQGFIYYALRYGYTVTPSYAFGERLTYSNVQGCFTQRFWLNNRGILAILPWGRSWCPLFPKPVFLHTVIGKPIKLPHIKNPTSEDVNLAHQLYMNAMTQLFDKYKCYFYGREGLHLSLELW